MLSVAVVILNWNGESFLRKFLPNVVAHSALPDVQVIVADNGSTDGSLELLKTRFPEVGIIPLKKNYGFTGGYNRSLSQVKAKYYVLLNSDVDVPEGWLSPLIQFMESNPNAAACMPKMLDYNNPENFEYAGAAGGFIDWLGYPFCRGRILSSIEKDMGQYNTPIQVMWASGACLFIRSTDYHKARGLDDDFFAHMEEIDLCWRLKNMGRQIWCIPQSEVFHVGGGTLPNNNPRKLYLNYRNNLFMLFKNLPLLKVYTIIPLRMVLDLASAVVYLLTKRKDFAKAVINAHTDYIKAIPNLKAKKALTPPQTKRHSQVLVPSILLNFFLLRKKTFSKLSLNKH